MACTCVWASTQWIQCPRRPEEDIRTPGAGVIGFNEQPGINARNQTLDEHSSFLTAEVSLQT